MSKQTKLDLNAELEEVEYYSIDEWKKKFGTPGNAGKPDQNGRIAGWFPTEPEFCEVEDDAIDI